MEAARSDDAQVDKECMGAMKFPCERPAEAKV